MIRTIDSRLPLALPVNRILNFDAVRWALGAGQNLVITQGQGQARRPDRRLARFERTASHTKDVFIYIYSETSL